MPGVQTPAAEDQQAFGGTSNRGSRSSFNPFRRLRIGISTVFRLGIGNVGRVALYRSLKRAGFYRWLLPCRAEAPLAVELHPAQCVPQAAPWGDRAVLREANELLHGRATWFQAHTHEIGSPPDWFMNPIQNKRHPNVTDHWSRIADFSEQSGDIKIMWEMSRFSWASVFARAWRISGDLRYLDALVSWMEDWWKNNPPNRGPNWMCGQETSIRLINAILAWRLVALEPSVAAQMAAFVEAHCRRIQATTLYGIGQDNNHGTSEAAALFIAGTWLSWYGKGKSRWLGRHWGLSGRKMLEDRVRCLVMPDGSFSQHSLTYHRLMLESLSLAEVWRRHMGEVSFSSIFYSHAEAATRWLAALIDPETGDGPNLGPNDGANPWRLHCSRYRDFRPCLQLASVLFTLGPALDSGTWDETLAWLGILTPSNIQPWLKNLGSAVFPDGGYVILRNERNARLLLRAQKPWFRPTHADALHVDLWFMGENIVRDGGTYSYYGGALAEELCSVAGHNTLEFDSRDQMPRLGRFLYGGWIGVKGDLAIKVTNEGQTWSGMYKDSWGVQHRRTVTLRDKMLVIRDELNGFRDKAVLRWRLAPGEWLQNVKGCASAKAQIAVESSVPICRISLEKGSESRHYLEKSPIPVLEVEVQQCPAVLNTTITLF